MTFYKILDFKYKGRSFTAFRNNLGYQTFLEYRRVGEKREYHYIDQPTYEKLYDIFLNRKASFYDDGNKNKGIFNFIPKIISKAGTLLLVASLTACGVPSNTNANHYDPSFETSQELQLWPNQIFDDNEVIITDDYQVYEVTKSVNLLTVDGLNLYWTNESRATYDDVRAAIESNKNLDEYLSNYIYDFLDKLEARYPNMSMACFLHNVENLKSAAVSDFGMYSVSGSSSTTACFVASESTIYYNTDRLDDENFEYIMYHEIGHMLLNGEKEIKGYNTKRHYTTGNNTGFMIEEALDTLLIEDVIGVSLSDVAYRLPANYVEIMMKAIGYDFQDYVNGYHVDFENRIKNYLQDPEFDVDSLPYLMEYQKYNIRQNNDVEIDDSEFYDLYKVVAGVYFKNNIEYCTSRENIIALYDQLVLDITKEVYSKEGEYVFDFTGLRDGLKRILRNYNISESIYPSDDELNVIVSVGEPNPGNNLSIK